MNSAALVPSFIEISGKFSSVDAPSACDVATPITFWIPFGFTFNTTNVIWLNSNGTGVPIANFYSDTLIVREWDGVSVLGNIGTCPTIASVQLSFSLVSCNVACEEVATEYFTSGPIDDTDTKIYQDANGLIPAIAGFYSSSIGGICAEWDGTDLGADETCGTVFLGFDELSDATACADPAINPYSISGGTSFATATDLWEIDAIGVDAAPLGFYSDGVIWREWDGGAFISNGNC